MASREVTIRLSSDVSTLGPDADRDDLDRYGENLAELISEEFRVRVHVTYGTTLRTECDDDEILERIRNIEGGDMWLTLLGEAP
jgi:hypothetical protein